MRRILTLVWGINFYLFLSAYGQNKELLFPRLYNDLYGPDLEKIFIDQNWYKGTINLNDNTELVGLLNYNASTGILRYKNNEEIKSFLPRAVVSFRLEDKASSADRLFYSFEYEDEDNPIKQAHFFEVIREYEDFAVLSEASKIELKVAKNGLLNGNNNAFWRQDNKSPQNIGLGTEQKICLYIFDFKNEKIEKIFEERIRFKQPDVFRRVNSDIKNTFEGREYFRNWMGTNFERVENYRKEYDLRYKSAIDIISLIDFYVSIRE